MISKLIRPRSEKELSSIVNKIFHITEKGNYKDATEICKWLIEDPKTKVAGLRELATVKEHMGDIDGAINALHELIKINSYPEPHDYYQLGLLFFKNKEYLESIMYFSKAIELGEVVDSKYYTNSSLLHRADAQLILRNFESAINDCMLLPPEYNAYLYGRGIRSREQIQSEAKAAR